VQSTAQEQGSRFQRLITFNIGGLHQILPWEAEKLQNPKKFLCAHLGPSSEGWNLLKKPHLKQVKIIRQNVLMKLLQ